MSRVDLPGGIAAKLARRLASADGTAAARLRAAYLGKGCSVEAYRACPLYVVAVEGDRLALEGVWRFAGSGACSSLLPQPEHEG